MAIELKIIESPGFGRAGNSALPVLRAPFTTQHITAAGLSAAFQSTTRVILVRNYGDAVHIRPNATGVTTNASATDAGSVKLRATSDEMAFDLTTVNSSTGVPTATSVKLDVRA